MRGLTLTLLLCGFLVPITPSHAQTRERVKISSIRIGLPVSGRDTSRNIFKPGQWAPVYVELECVRDTEEPLLLIVETTDVDGVITEGSVQVTAMAKGDRLSGAELGPLPYLKPGGSYSEVSVRVKGAESGKLFGESGKRNPSGLDAAPFVIAAVGFNIGTMRLPTADAEREEEATKEMRGGWIETAQILRVDQMPDQWFGYGAIDVVILSSGGDRTFWEILASKQHASRRRALIEWVRRGGKLIVSVGNNPDLIESFKELRDILPVTIPADAKQNAKILLMEWTSTVERVQKPGLSYRENADFAWVKAIPRNSSHVMVRQINEQGQVLAPVVVQGSHGLGRVTFVGFDLDRSPYVDWKDRAAFWENLLNNSGYILPPVNAKFQKFGYGAGRADYAGSMQGNLDFFEGVPIVSFGWVALFILIYIVLIGPVDYLFLKKVVKRLEWTWVTFPIMVVVVSAGAYFAAYAIKGNDLKINKIDVVDIDLAGKRMDGHSYFTLFSPRIADYTIAVEPSGDDGDSETTKWVPGKSHDAAYNTTVSWFGKVKDSYYSSNQGGLFSKRFRYQSVTDPNEPDRVMYAAGLERVPIQVWTTKSFVADWSIALDPNTPPIIADLAIAPADPDTLMGTITNNLPVEQFTDIALMWRGKVVDLSDLPKGVSHPVSLSVGRGDVTKSVSDIKNWLGDSKRNKDSAYPIPKQTPGNYSAGTPSDPNFRLWPVLFYDATEPSNRGTESPNAALRPLDQSWRVREKNRGEQALLVLRTPTKETRAEEMTKSNLSPSRLWLGQLPSTAEKRQDLQGTMRQETYIRVFIPVKTPIR